MSKYFFYFAVLQGFLMLAGCSSSDNASAENSDAMVKALAGNWQWIRSTGSIAGITVTPESSGRTMEIEFTTDNIFNKFVDGQLVYTSPFALQEKDSSIQYTTLAIFEGVGLGFDHQVEQQFHITKDNTLLLIDPCCDNFTFEFGR